MAGREVAGRRAGLIAAGITAALPRVPHRRRVAAGRDPGGPARGPGGVGLLPALAPALDPEGGLARRPVHPVRPDAVGARAAGDVPGGPGRARVPGPSVACTPGPVRGVGPGRRVCACSRRGGRTRCPGSRTRSSCRTSSGVTLASANCNQTYHGRLLGYWSFACTGAATPRRKDASAADQEPAGSRPSTTSNTTLGQVPAVVAARFGRAFGVFVPWQEIDLEWARIGRPRLPATIGLFAYYGLVVFAVGGAVVLRRRRVTLYPAAVILAEVALVAIAIFGQTRYRTPLDVVLVVLAAVAVDHLWQGRAGRARHGIKSAGAPPPQPAPPPIPTARRRPRSLPRRWSAPPRRRRTEVPPGPTPPDAGRCRVHTSPDGDCGTDLTACQIAGTIGAHGRDVGARLQRREPALHRWQVGRCLGGHLRRDEPRHRRGRRDRAQRHGGRRRGRCGGGSRRLAGLVGHASGRARRPRWPSGRRPSGAGRGVAAARDRRDRRHRRGGIDVAGPDRSEPVRALLARPAPVAQRAIPPQVAVATPLAPGGLISALALRQPVGVVACITSYNFPLVNMAGRSPPRWPWATPSS